MFLHSVHRPFICLLQRKKTSIANVWSHNVGLAPFLLFPVRGTSGWGCTAHGPENLPRKLRGRTLWSGCGAMSAITPVYNGWMHPRSSPYITLLPNPFIAAQYPLRPLTKSCPLLSLGWRFRRFIYPEYMIVTSRACWSFCSSSTSTYSCVICLISPLFVSSGSFLRRRVSCARTRSVSISSVVPSTRYTLTTWFVSP